MKKRVIIFLLLPFLLTSCSNRNDISLCDNEVSILDIDLFEKNLKAELTAHNPMGYSYVISKKGQVVLTGNAGKARSVNDGNLPMTTNTVMHIASVSKTITTAAVLKLLEAEGLTPDDKFYPYLPPHWTIAESTKLLSFEDLLLHRVWYPFQGDGSVKYDSIRAYVMRGLKTSIPEKYTNLNHSVLRVIISGLWDKYRPSAGSTGYDEAFTASVYEKYIQEEIFQPLNITGTLNTLGNNQVALAYTDANDNTGEFGPDDFRLVAGAYGWQLSVLETAKFWAYLWFSNDILSEQNKTLMKNNAYGLWNTITGEHGKYYGKAGGWFRNKNGKEHWYKTFVILYPDDVQVSLFINSNTSKSLARMLRDAYDASFVDTCL